MNAINVLKKIYNFVGLLYSWFVQFAMKQAVDRRDNVLNFNKKSRKLLFIVNTTRKEKSIKWEKRKANQCF